MPFLTSKLFQYVYSLRHLHVHLFVKLRIHKCIDGVVLDEFEVEPCGNGDKCAEASSSQGRSVGTLSKVGGLLVTSDNKARLTFEETPVFIKFVEIYPHAIE